MSNTQYQKPVQIAIDKHVKLKKLSVDTGINMRRLIEDALLEKYPKVFKK